MIAMVCPYSTGWPSSTQTFLTVPAIGDGTWFIVFIASTIIIVSPLLIFFPTSTNFFPPGSGAKYAVPIIGDGTLVPTILSDSIFSTPLVYIMRKVYWLS